MPDQPTDFNDIIRKVARYLRHEAQAVGLAMDEDGNPLKPGIAEAARIVDRIISVHDRLGRYPMKWYMADDEPDDPREDKDWPEEEDCPGCDGHKDRGPHRFGCSIHGKQQPWLPAKKNEDGTVSVTFPVNPLDPYLTDPVIGPAIDLHRNIPLTEDK